MHFHRALYSLINNQSNDRNMIITSLIQQTNIDHDLGTCLYKFNLDVFFLQSVVTPIGFLFWTIFSESPFAFDPSVHVTTWFSIGALVFMVPAIFIYNTG